MKQESRTGTPAGLFRRLAALLYDLILTTALAFIATFAMLPLTRGEAILTATQGAAGHLYHAILFLIVFAYFGWCWTRTGQTLGMKAWRIRLLAAEGRHPSWAEALLRFTLGAAITLMAVAGIAYLLRSGGGQVVLAGLALLLPAVLNFAWIALNRDAQSLQDLAGKLRVIRTI